MRNYETPNPDGKAADVVSRVGWSRAAILAKARELLSLGGLQARREIVRTALELDRLLGGRN